MDRQYMSEWAQYEQHGIWPDSVFVPDDEFDSSDPDQVEIAGLVVENYDAENQKKHERLLRDRIEGLEQILTENGIEVPADF